MKAKISVCLITKDNAATLDKCLKSIKKIASQILVLDLDSQDKSLRIAKKYGQVYKSKPKNDQSKVRNLLLKHATGDWILFMEPRDILPEKSGKELIQLLASVRENNVVYRLKVIQLIRENNPSTSSYREMLFPNQQGIRYEGPISEYLNHPKKVIKYENVPISVYNLDSSLPYQQIMQESQSRIKKLTQLIESGKYTPKLDYYYFNLGNEYSRIGEFYKAAEAYRYAVQCLPKEKFPQSKLHFYGNLLIKYAGNSAFGTQDYKNGLELSQTLLKTSPDFPDALFLQAYCHTCSNNLVQAIILFEKLLKIMGNTSNNLNPLGLTSLEASLYPLVHHQLGRCQLLSGNKTSGLEHLLQAYRFDPQSTDIKMHLIRYYLLENNLEQALRYYFQNTRQNYSEKEKKQLQLIAQQPVNSLIYRTSQLQFLNGLQQHQSWLQQEKAAIEQKIKEVSQNIL